MSGHLIDPTEMRPADFNRRDRDMDEHVSIQARPAVSAPWEHVKSVPAWAMADRGHAAIQRAHVRKALRVEWGQDSPVLLRVVTDDGAVIA